MLASLLFLSLLAASPLLFSQGPVPGNTVAPTQVWPQDADGQVARVHLYPARKSGTAVFKQGQAFLVRIENLPESAVSAQAMWENQVIPCFKDRDGQSWSGLGGIDRELAPGTYELMVTAITPAGGQVLATQSFRVLKRKFSGARLRVSPQMAHVPPEQQASVDADRAAFQAVWAGGSPERYWSGPFRRPVPGEITAPFGQRRVYNGDVKGVHTGVDLEAKVGAPIKAAAAGEIALIRACYIEGNTVVIDHGGGVFTVYCHLSKFKVELGQIVEKGQVIGLIGATGRVTGPHLHFGAQVQGVKVDPLTLLYLNPWL